MIMPKSPPPNHHFYCSISETQSLRTCREIQGYQDRFQRVICVLAPVVYKVFIYLFLKKRKNREKEEKMSKFRTQSVRWLIESNTQLVCGMCFHIICDGHRLHTCVDCVDTVPSWLAQSLNFQENPRPQRSLPQIRNAAGLQVSPCLRAPPPTSCSCQEHLSGSRPLSSSTRADM